LNTNIPASQHFIFLKSNSTNHRMHMQMQMPQSEKGASKVSIWPLRREKRHMAVKLFNDKIEEFMTRIEQKMEMFENRMFALEKTILHVERVVANKNEHVEVNLCNFQDLGDRLEDAINVITETTNKLDIFPSQQFAEMVKPGQSMERGQEIEMEKTNKRGKGSGGSKQDSQALSSGQGEGETGACTNVLLDGSLDLVQMCSSKLQSLMPKLRTTNKNKPRQEYLRFLFEKIDDVFQHLPYRTDSTRMLRDVFDQKYPGLQRTDLWHFAVRKYHGGTGNPMSKSDSFIKVMHAIRQFDEQLETTSISGDDKK